MRQSLETFYTVSGAPIEWRNIQSKRKEKMMLTSVIYQFSSNNYRVMALDCLQNMSEFLSVEYYGNKQTDFDQILCVH